MMGTSLIASPLQHAEAVWIVEDQTIQKGSSLRTVIKMKVNDGWHTYWENPGEGGLPLSIDAELPEGWSLEDILYPAPKRFKTGELHGFGYEGEIHFPLNVIPPTDFEGKLPPVTATFSWLTCNDATCVPGEAELNLSTAETDREIIRSAYAALPNMMENASLSVESSGKTITMRLTLPADSKLIPSELSVFPATRNVIDPAAKPVFEAADGSQNAWIATAPASEYFSELPDSFKLVVSAKDGTSYVIHSE